MKITIYFALLSLAFCIFTVAAMSGCASSRPLSDTQLCKLMKKDADRDSCLMQALSQRAEAAKLQAAADSHRPIVANFESN